METAIKERNRVITHLLNSTNISLQSILSMGYKKSKPRVIGKGIEVEFAVLIGITGDLKGSIVLSGERDVFSSVGEAMFGMVLENEMLDSFSGELGNMLAGSISANIIEHQIKTDITAPTIITGNTTLSGYENAVRLTVEIDSIGNLDIHLLIN